MWKLRKLYVSKEVEAKIFWVTKEGNDEIEKQSKSFPINGANEYLKCIEKAVHLI